jgi:glycosyltransferase involved in cell wall biosynthesis
VQLAGDRPVWADLFGHTLAEGQAKARLHGDDDLLLPYWQMEVRTILRADAFSVVSRPQGDALLGELGLAGRLGASTEDHVFARVIPCAAPEPVAPDPATPSIRGRVLPEDAFVALWIGGYNTWADTDTLLRGLEQAMDGNPRLHFLSTGGSLAGQDEATYPALRARVERSRHAGRFHWLGWVDPSTLARCLLESDVGVNVDRDIPESRFGSRNRIPVMLAHGLPVVSSRVSEVSTMVEEIQGGVTFAPGDAASLARRLVELAAGRRGAAAKAELRARAAAALSFEATAAPLLPFVAAPRRAPDALHPGALGLCLSSGPGQGLQVLDGKDREIAALRGRLEDVSRHVRNLEALVEEKDAALVELRRFERRVKGLAPIRALLALRGRS